jgi:serine/threonine protein phosphatase PrpC
MLLDSSLVTLPRASTSEDALPLTNPSEASRLEPVGRSIDVFGATDIGRVRERNEDQFLVADLNRTMVIRQSSLAVPEDRRVLPGEQGKLLVVADGVGGHGAGDLASAVAVNALGDAFLHSVPWVYEPGDDGDEARDALVSAAFRQALARCEAQVHAVAQQRGLVALKMATTLTTAVVIWPRLYVAHVGDSRCYLFRDGKLRRITRDHTVAAQLGAEDGPFKHVLSNAIGGADERLMVELHRVNLEHGDAVLLCTDGLTGHLSDENIAAQIAVGGGARFCCETLVAAAKQAGGKDNITAVVAYC